MFLSFENKTILTPKVFMLHNLATYNFGATEKALDKFLNDKYKISLHEACILLINNIKQTTNLSSNTLIITFKTNWLDKLASIITYGNGKLQGSNILFDIIR